MTAMMMTTMTKETAWIASRIVSVIATNDSWNAFSVSVSVSASEFLKVASISRRHLGRLLGVLQPDDEQPGLVGAARIDLRIFSFSRSQWKNICDWSVLLSTPS